jgi:signal transduction histidine kinase
MWMLESCNKEKKRMIVIVLFILTLAVLSDLLYCFVNGQLLRTYSVQLVAVALTLYLQIHWIFLSDTRKSNDRGVMNGGNVLKLTDLQLLIISKSGKVLKDDTLFLQDNISQSVVSSVSIYDFIHKDDINKFKEMVQKVLHDCNGLDETNFHLRYRIDRRSKDKTMKNILVESFFCKERLLYDSFDQADMNIVVVSRVLEQNEQIPVYDHGLGSSEQSRINAAKLRYISCIAHDLRTPLQSFSYTMQLLLQTRLEPDQWNLVRQALLSVDLMQLVTSQTMDIGRVLSGIPPAPRRTVTQISEVIKRVDIIIAGYRKSVPITYEVSPTVIDTIITDEEWLWQMLLNLLTNACKYTTAGSIKVRVEACVDTHMLNFAVIDTGTGVDTSQAEVIFEAFSRSKNLESVSEGTGLGLFGLKCRVQSLGGSCGVSKNEEAGKGSIFWFKIPYIVDNSIDYFETKDMYGILTASRHEPDLFASTWHYQNELLKSGVPQYVSSATITQNVPPKVAESNHSEGRSMKMDKSYVAETKQMVSDDKTSQAKIKTEKELLREYKLSAMVIEDTPSVLKLMKRTLTMIGFERVECYVDGKQGLDALKTQEVDIVFSDISMPVMTGSEVIYLRLTYFFLLSSAIHIHN